MSAQRDPFSLLVDMANGSLAGAGGLPEQAEAKSTWTGVGFILSGQKMAAPMGEVAELMHVPGWTKLPGVQAWVKGVANVRGRLLPLIDTEAFFGGQLAGSHKSRRVMAVERGDLFAGLVVSEVIGMLHFPVDTFLKKIPVEAAAFAEYSLGSYIQDGEPWTVFSPFRLAMDSRFNNAAA